MKVKELFEDSNKGGLAGCVQSSKNRHTETIINVYNAKEAGIDSEDKWITSCEDHGQMISSKSLSKAKNSASYPEWCSECKKIMEEK